MPLRLVVEDAPGDDGGRDVPAVAGGPTKPAALPSAVEEAGEGAVEDLAAFDDAGAVAAPAADPEARVLEAFPGAEEVS